MQERLKERIEALVSPYLEELTAELVELNIRRRGKTAVVEIIADKPGGITIGECSYINKKIDRLVERKQWFGEDYIVEVSSPGLDRALKTGRDFARVLTRLVRFHLLEPVEGKIEHSGEVAQVMDDQVLIKKDQNIIAIPLNIISKAVQVIE